MLMVIHVCTWRCLLLRYDECRQLIPITAASVKPCCTGPCLQSTAGIVAKDDVLRAFPLAGPRDCWLAIRCVKIRWQYNMVAGLLYLVCMCKSMGYGQQYCMCMHKCCTVTCSSCMNMQMTESEATTLVMQRGCVAPTLYRHRTCNTAILESSSVLCKTECICKIYGRHGGVPYSQSDAKCIVCSRRVCKSASSRNDLTNVD